MIFIYAWNVIGPRLAPAQENTRKTRWLRQNMQESVTNLTALLPMLPGLRSIIKDVDGGAFMIAIRVSTREFISMGTLKSRTLDWLLIILHSDDLA